MEIKELFKEEQKYWKKKNIELFGLNPIEDDKPFAVIQESINKSCEKYWNVDKPCKLAQLLNDGTLDKSANSKIKNTYELKLNIINMCIDVLAKYKVGNDKKLLRVCSLPTPSVNLSWIINNSHYTPRVTATTDQNTLIMLNKAETKVLGKFWSYDLAKEEFECTLKKNKFDVDPKSIFDKHLSNRSKALLQHYLGDKVLNETTLKEALSKLKKIDYNSIFNYKFSRFEYFEDLVLGSRKYADPIKNIILGISSTFVSQAKQYTATGEKLEGQLVLSESPIFSLEQFRTVINIYKSDTGFIPQFTYKDTNGFFDSFRTATSKSAGRQRLLLDNISIKDGMLWVKEEDCTEHNMYEYINNPQSIRLSCLSYSPFCHNDQAKRIMMTAKMSSQAVTLKNEKDKLTHRIPARVIFADIEGYTYADSIVISESFAKKLTTFSNDIITLSTESEIYKKLFPKGHKGVPVNTPLTIEQLQLLYPTKAAAILDSYKNSKITLIDFIPSTDDLIKNDYIRLFISWEIPFRLGDKISNLHGAKGVVGKILPDNEMPILTKKCGTMEPGPMEVVISGFSTIRRGSLGQLFEAWYNASGLTIPDSDKYISIVSEKYGNQLQKFVQNSVIEFNGERSIKPIGIIDMIRLYHHASIHISESGTDKNFNKMLKFGEMEKFNLLASKSTNILKELSIRSMQKYIGGQRLVKEMEQTRELPKNPIYSLRFAKLLKSFGYDIQLNGKSLVASDKSIITMLTDEDKEELNNWYWEEN